MENNANSGCLTLFGVPFACAGLFAIWMGIRGLQQPQPGTQHPAVAVFVGGIFCLVGVLMIAAGLQARRKAAEFAGVKDMYPDQPWMWRSDWASGVARSSNLAATTNKWVFAALWNSICAVIGVVALPDLLRKREPWSLLLLLFVVVGVLLLVDAIRQTVRRAEFGVGALDLRSLPYKAGGPLEGVIHARFRHLPEKGVHLRCTCVQRTTSGSGDNRSTTEHILWREETTVPPTALGQGGEGMTIPVSFRLPPDQPQTYTEEPDNQILWVVQATAEVPGVDYDDSFEVPVFGKVSAPAASQASGVATAPGARAEAPEPERHTIQVTPTADGIQFYFPADRNPGAAAGITVFAAIFAGAFFFLVKVNAPLIFPIAFGFFDALMFLIALYVWVGTSNVTIGSGRLSAHSGIFGLGPTRVVALDQIQAIDYAIGMQTGGAQGTPYYDIRLTPASGTRITLGSAVKDKKEVEWLIARMRSAAGVKNTVPRDDIPADLITPNFRPLSFTTPTPPLAGRRAGPLRFIPLLVFLGIAGSFAWQMGLLPDLLAYLKLKVHQSSAPPLERPSLTDSDLQRILRMSPQRQAERLMEAAIQHDPAAREQILARAAGWRGHLRNTPEWQKLEYRATYSKDLRVREAVLEIDLAMWQLDKTSESVKSLIAQADDNRSSRPQTAYRLGVLANRGVEPELVHATLLEYAHDPDPVTRQWAAEGLRFLRTDQALDDLFEIFTHDESFTVRDRAGCNVSDCGIFSRVQRMRMVPKLLDLGGDPDLNPTMRHWVFLALSEITDESHPEDINAWRDWYAQHGAEKSAQFERLPSWQVRGDE